MGFFEGSSPKTKRVISLPQLDLLKNTTSIGTNFLKEFAGGDFVSGLLDKFSSGPSDISSLSLAGLENIAAGGGEGAVSSNAANEAVQSILGSTDFDVDEFVRESVFEPALAEAEDLIPFIQRQGAATQNRFGDSTSRAVGDLLADVARSSSSARAAAALAERQASRESKLQAAQLGLGAPLAEIRELASLAGLGNLEAEQMLSNIANTLGIPLEIILSMGQIATSPTKGVGTQGPNVLAEALAGAIGGTLGTAGEATVGALFEACHAAAVYFGWLTPKWWAARTFILNGGLGIPFTRWYSLHSAALASVLRASPKERALWRPIFELAAREGSR